MHYAQIALPDDNAPAPAPAVPATQARKPNLMLRNDTLLGVCEAIGEDLGFHANWLRVPLALALFWNAQFVIAGYLVAGVVVAALRWIFPDSRAAETEPVQAAEPANTNEESLSLAA